MVVFKNINLWQLVFISILFGFYFNPVSAQENFVVTIGENKVFTEFNYNPIRFEDDASNPLPWPPNEINVDGNMASVSLTGNPGTAGGVRIDKGIQFDWNFGDYSWEQVKDLPVNVTVDFSYQLSASWVEGFGSANAAVFVPYFTECCVDSIGHAVGQSGSRSNTFRKTWTYTVEHLESLNRKIYVEVYSHVHSVSPICDQYGNCVSQIHYSSATAQVNSIQIEFLERPTIKITKTRMVNPSVLGIDATIGFPDNDPIEGPRYVEFRATINGQPIKEQIEVTDLVL